MSESFKESQERYLRNLVEELSKELRESTDRINELKEERKKKKKSERGELNALIEMEVEKNQFIYKTLQQAKFRRNVFLNGMKMMA